MNYLIAGTGGVGGSIAAFLALAGKDISLPSVSMDYNCTAT